MTEYEEMQLGLIAQTYAERGFIVRHNYRFRGEPYIFDAVARNGKRDIVIIEIVNKRRDEAQRFIVSAIERIRDRLPKTVVDFRYIDVDAGALRTAVGHGARLHAVRSRDNLYRLTRGEVPYLRPHRGVMEYLNLWTYYVDLIRAYALYQDRGAEHIAADGQLESVQTVYNNLLRAERLIPPEDTNGNVTMGLFDLYVIMQAAVQGASVSQQLVRQLMLHVNDVRLQIRAFLEAEER